MQSLSIYPQIEMLAPAAERMGTLIRLISQMSAVRWRGKTDPETYIIKDKHGLDARGFGRQK
jgi:hypothetical protein